MRDRQSLTKGLCAQYRKARKKAKGVLLDQFVAATGYNRSYARWLLRNHGRRVPVAPGVFVEGDARRSPERPRHVTYGPEVLGPLKVLWKMLDYLSGKRLAPALREVLPRLEALKEIRVNKAVRAKLLRVSPATIDRLLKPERAKHQLKGRSHTKPGTLLKEEITFTRSRPYRKNDTCYVEQKNWSIVRRFVGYGRLEGDASRELLDKLYDCLHHYNNLFLPSMKLLEKTRDGAKVTRKYDVPKTPYHRVLASTAIDGKAKTRLTRYYETLNPAQLNRDMQKLQGEIQKRVVRPLPDNGKKK